MTEGTNREEGVFLSNEKQLIYLDTNVYSRPFDDQTQPRIQNEANAFLDIILEVRRGRMTLLCSDILLFEVDNILEEEKRTKKISQSGKETLLFCYESSLVCREDQERRTRMSATAVMDADAGDVVREGWRILVEQLGIHRATQFVLLLERGTGDSVREIVDYWGAASIEEINDRVTAWKESRG